MIGLSRAVTALVWLLPGVNSLILTLRGVTATATAKSLQSCPTLWDPIDGSPPGSSVPGILQVRTLGASIMNFMCACYIFLYEYTHVFTNTVF